MAFTNLKKCVYSKKCLKQRHQPPPPKPSLQQSRRYIRAERVTWLQLLYNTVNPLLSPPGGLFFSSTFEAGLNREGGLKREGGGLFNLAKRITCSKNTVV